MGGDPRAGDETARDDPAGRRRTEPAGGEGLRGGPAPHRPRVGGGEERPATGRGTRSPAGAARGPGRRTGGEGGGTRAAGAGRDHGAAAVGEPDGGPEPEADRAPVSREGVGGGEDGPRSVGRRSREEGGRAQAGDGLPRRRAR